MNIMKPNFDTLIPDLLALAERAGSLISQLYDKEIEFVQKGDGSPVTEADKRSHELLKAGLEKLTPDIPVISEEDENSWKIKSKLYWLIDPLDGTKGFIYKTGDCCSNIALVERMPHFGLFYS